MHFDIVKIRKTKTEETKKFTKNNCIREFKKCLEFCLKMCANDFLVHLFRNIGGKMLPRGQHIRIQFLSTIFGKKNIVCEKEMIQLITNNSFSIHIFSTFKKFVSGNLINLTYGLTIGWIIVYTNHFNTSSNPLQVPPLDSIEVKWTELSFFLGGFIGTIFLTMIGDVFGRKYTLVILIVPQGVSLYSSLSNES